MAMIEEYLMKILSPSIDQEDLSSSSQKRRGGRSRLDYQNQLQSLISTDRKKLSKEQKVLIQKLKNRKSAQKSRDQKKQYIGQLEAQLSFLQSENARLTALIQKCQHCKHQALSTDKDSSDPSQDLDLDFGLVRNPSMEMLQQVWQPVGISQGDSFSKFMLLVVMLAAIVTSVSEGSPPTMNSPISLWSYQNLDNFNENIRFRPYRKQQICLLNSVKNQSRPKIINRLSQEVSVSKEIQTYKPQRVSHLVDTIYCPASKLIRSNPSSDPISISKHFEILLNGREIRELGWQKGETWGSMRCQSALYRIVAEVKDITRQKLFQCLID